MDWKGIRVTLILVAVLSPLLHVPVDGLRIKREGLDRCDYDIVTTTNSVPGETADARSVRKVHLKRETTWDRGTRDNDYILKGHDSHHSAWSESVTRSKRQLATSTNQLEMLLVLDKSAYDRFLARANGQEAVAQQEVARYFAGMVKEVNERFATIDTSGFSLRVIITKILILTTVTESAVTETLVSNGVINANNALDNFRILDNDLLKANNPRDYAMLVTGYDLRNGDSNTLGITFLKAACDNNSQRDYRQGVVEDLGDEQTAVTMAHEIGHAVGAGHDGLNNICANIFYTMAPSAAIPSSRSLAGNPFTFSTCSVQEIRTFLASPITDCLRSRQTAVGSEINIAALTTVEMGQSYNADEQCRLAFGVNSRFCRSQYTRNTDFTFDDMCYNMQCGVPGSGFCSSALAFDGTTCGDKKWCQDGLCVASSLAPGTPSSSCPQGDDPTAQCSQSLCSAQLYNNTLCCATCQQQTTTPRPSPKPVSVVQTTTTTTPTPPRAPPQVSVNRAGMTVSVVATTAQFLPHAQRSTVAALRLVSVVGGGPLPRIASLVKPTQSVADRQGMATPSPVTLSLSGS